MCRIGPGMSCIKKQKQLGQNETPLPGAPRDQALHLPFQSPLEASFSLQNRRFRPHFLNRKCRSRDSASIGALRAPKFGLPIYRKTGRPHRQTKKKNSRPFSEPRFPSLAIPNARAHAGIDDAVRGATLPPHSDVSPHSIRVRRRFQRFGFSLNKHVSKITYQFP